MKDVELFSEIVSFINSLSCTLKRPQHSAVIAGELVPVYKAELVNAFLSGTKDDDFLVRASSLSNLGELCRLLGFRVGPIVTEVNHKIF